MITPIKKGNKSALVNGSAGRNSVTLKRLYIVLGTHRSGTSAVTRGVQCLGVDLGPKLSDAGPDNETGFWEDKDVVALNEDLLSAASLSWHTVMSADTTDWDAPAFVSQRNAICALLKERFLDRDAWAFKDPRTMQTLAVWKHCAEHLGLDIAYIVVVRNPENVAKSLALRNNFSRNKGLAIWLRDYLPLVGRLAEQKYAFIDYDLLLDSPQQALERLQAQLELPSNECVVNGIQSFIDDFLDASVSHKSKLVSNLSSTKSPENVAAQAYHALKKVSMGSVSLGDIKFAELWEGIVLEYANNSVKGGVIRDILTEELQFYIEQIRQQQQEMGRQQQEMGRQQQEINRLQKAVVQISEKIKDDFRDIENRDIEIRRLQAVLVERDQHITEIGDRLHRLEIAYQEEKFTVLRPVLRKGYRILFKLSEPLPDSVKQTLRAIKRKIVGTALTTEVIPSATKNESMQLLEEIQGTKRGEYDVVIFPVIDWEFRFQRPQHIARQLVTQGLRVFYLSTTFTDNETKPYFNVLQKTTDGVFICQLGCPFPHPNIYQDSLNNYQLVQLSHSLCQLREQCDIKAMVSIVDLPFWRSLAIDQPGNHIVYDCMDYHAGFTTNHSVMLSQEERLFEQADLILFTSDYLARMHPRVERYEIVRNGVEFEHFAKAAIPGLGRSDRPVVGYVGAISSWFDIKLVIGAAQHYPDWDFVLVGDVFQCDIAAARAIANIRFVGEVHYSKVPAHIASFDVCIIPFLLSDLTHCTNPVKIYEYLACGKPVVTTKMSEISFLSTLVHISESPEVFIENLLVAMGETGDEGLKADRCGWAKNNDWSLRAEQVRKSIDELFPAVSIVVLTHNNLQYTQACIESLFENTHYPKLEVMVVDNDSTDGTRDYLEGKQADHHNLKLIFNRANVGFSAGNNIGLKAATGEILILLNNDTYVTQGWVSGLVRHLQQDDLLGLIGPVTNNIGNEAKIDIQYTDMSEMLLAANRYTASHTRKRLDTDRLGFFCVAMRREVFDKVGLLDESYGLGFFEDDDYCHRVSLQGYKIGIAEDVFIHHHLSASFDKIGEEKKMALFEKNKKIYEHKWGEWKPHKYRKS